MQTLPSTMTIQERALARILFCNKVLSSDGQAYEVLFTQVLTKKYPDFVQVKPQGRFGDRKNDGYSKSIGLFTQVYAPENLQDTETKAVKKTSDSFAGLKKYWDTFCPVKRFFFVINDKYKGTFPEIEKVLASIKSSHDLDECGSFLAKHLEDALFELSDDQILAIVGFLPAPEKIQRLDYSVMNQVLAHLMAHVRQLQPIQILNAPDFEDKIVFNDLGQAVGALLKTASFHAGLVDEYFSLNSNFVKQEVRNNLNEIYLQKTKSTFGIDGLTAKKGDRIFFEILKEITPNTKPEAQNAALVIMAFFFESCDIFEAPKKQI